MQYCIIVLSRIWYEIWCFWTHYKSKGKIHPSRGNEDPGGVGVQLYSLFNLGARLGMGCQRQAPAALSPEKGLFSIEMSLKILFPNITEILLCSTTLSLSQVPVFLGI